MSNEVANISNTTLAALAERAKAAAARERPAVGNFSLKSGVLSYAGSPIPGNKTEAIIMAAAFRNVWYANRYDPNNIVNPNCFALSMSDEGMAPHENVSEPAHDTCAGCPYNEWGSDPNGGRGKACKQSRRLVMIPAAALTQPDPVAGVQSAEFAKMDLPVTSVKNYSSFVNTLAASANVPPFAAVAEISVVPDAKTQFKVMFKPMRVLPSEEVLNAVMARLNAAEALALEPYEETATADDAQPEPAAPAPAAKKASKKY